MGLRIWLIAGFLGFAVAQTSFSDSIGPSPRQMLVLQGQGRTLWGTYFFAIENRAKTPQSYRYQVRLPLESVDFSVQQGLDAADLTTDPSGSLVIAKEFPPGLTLAGIGFKIPVTDSVQTITLKPELDVGELSVAASRSSQLTVRAQDLRFQPGLPHMLSPDGWHGVMSREALKAGEVLRFDIRGFPASRTKLWIIAGIFLALLLVLSFGLTLAKRSGGGHRLAEVGA